MGEVGGWHGLSDLIVGACVVPDLDAGQIAPE
jgi:hypothetical protein